LESHQIPQKQRWLKNIANSFKASIQAPKYQFGITVPTSAKHALELDKKIGNNLSREAIDLEMKQINDYKRFAKSIEERI
jgi:hypothetical protein